MATKRSDDAKFSAPPTGSGDSSGPTPIGVPKGYTVAGRGTARILGKNVPVPRRIEPLYFDGDEYGPSTLASEDQARLQMAMRSVGLYTSGEKFRVGTWDSNTRSAYRKLLEFANGKGVSWQEALGSYAAEGAGEEMDGGGGSTRAPLVRKQSNALEIAEIYESTRRARTGRKPLPADVSRFVNAYLAQERGQQEAAYAAGEGGGVVEELADPELLAKKDAETADPAGAFRQDAIDVFQLLGNVLTGGGGGLSGE